MTGNYYRHDGSDSLENEVRRSIYEFVRRSPGVYRAEVASELGVAPATVRYHGRVLEDEGVLKTARIRNRERYFPSECAVNELAAVLNDGPAAAVLATVARLEQANTSELADELGRAPSTITYHLQRLAELELVERERNGHSVVTRLPKTVRARISENDIRTVLGSDELTDDEDGTNTPCSP